MSPIDNLMSPIDCDIKLSCNRRSQYQLPWAVNYSVAQPGDARLLLTVGDDPAAHLYDASSGRQVGAWGT